MTSNAQANITSVGVLTSLSSTGNITGANINGNGSGLSSITGANITGTVANATFATTAGSATSAGTAGTVTSNAQANITSVGTLSSLSVTGNIATSGNFVGNGAALTGIVATTAATVTGNAQANITSVGTLTSLSVTGNIETAGNFVGNGAALTGITASTANAASFLIDPTAPGVNVSVSNALSSLNFPQGGLISWAGDGFDPNTGGSLDITNGGNVANAYVSLTFANTANFFANPINTVNVSNVGMAFKYDFLGGFGGTKTLLLDSTGMSLDTTFSATGNVTGGNLRTGGQVSATGTITGGNLATGGTTSATGNITGGNISTGGLITATGNITGGNITGVSGSVATGIINYKDYVATITYASTITPNIALGSIQQVTLTGNVTMNAFGGTPQAGQSMVIKFIQDATGGRTLTSSMKWAGGLKTLTATANAVDIASVFYDGTTYYASLTNNYS